MTPTESTTGEDATGVAQRTPGTGPIEVLIVDADSDSPESIEAAVSGGSDLAAHTESDPRAALDRIAEVDCIVSEVATPSLDGRDLLDAVRERDPGLPFVFYTDAEFDAVADDVLTDDNAEYVESWRGETGADLLRQRIVTLVENTRLEAALERSRAAVEACRTPVLVVDPEGTVTHANERLSSALARGDDLAGRPWDDLFTDDAVCAIRTEAVPVAAEGWNWTGTTTLATREGERVSARADLVRLDDGGLVFAFHDLDRRGQ